MFSVVFISMIQMVHGVFSFSMYWTSLIELNSLFSMAKNKFCPRASDRGEKLSV